MSTGEFNAGGNPVKLEISAGLMVPLDSYADCFFFKRLARNDSTAFEIRITTTSGISSVANVRRYELLADTCANVASGLSNVAGITA